MDSVTQFVLGASVGVAAMGRRAPAWQAALWGGVCATLPDLDVLIDHGDPISNMTFHRAESHSLFFVSLVSPLLAWLIWRIHRGAAGFRRWWLAVWLALVTHPLLDWLTVYGTQLGLPFTDYPFAIGSIFVIDPVYTVVLAIGVVAALAAGRGESAAKGRRWNLAGLALGTAYLAWSLVAQQLVTTIATASLREQGIPAQRLLVVPTAFNTLLWRVLAIEGDRYAEGYYSLFDRDRRIAFRSYPRGEDLYRRSSGNWYVARIAWFSHGFFGMREENGRLLISDLRMGQEPSYTFTFEIPPGTAAAQATPPVRPVAEDSSRPRLLAQRVDLRAGVTWLWQRMWGGQVPYPPGPAASSAN
jgi:inner membrane protein